ncbi:MAG: hypothetical protein PHF21_02685 [Bacilli bacterium]|nr:hypothetical protein [Bacilli bacterium]
MKIKMQVTPEQSKQVQEACYADRLQYCSNNNIFTTAINIINLDMQYLYISYLKDDKGLAYIEYGNDNDYFITAEATQLSPEDFITKLNNGELK